MVKEVTASSLVVVVVAWAGGWQPGDGGWVSVVTVAAPLQAAWTPRASCAGCSVGPAPAPRCCRTPTPRPPSSMPRTLWS